MSAAKMTVTRQSDGADLVMTKMPLLEGFADYSTIAFRPEGWTPGAGEVYTVSIQGVAGATITYEVRPTVCN
ncbi:MAG: hypothetical protein CSA75_02170 [Sorangium cellulosum]|nr:MAG: hypothetical protein CSA75_02170 [Sorangium cellulosum]